MLLLIVCVIMLISSLLTDVVDAFRFLNLTTQLKKKLRRKFISLTLSLSVILIVVFAYILVWDINPYNFNEKHVNKEYMHKGKVYKVIEVK